MKVYDCADSSTLESKHIVFCIISDRCGPDTYSAKYCALPIQGWRNDSRGGGTRTWGPSRKRVPKCIKEPKTTYTTIAVAEKRSKRCKKGPFLLYIGAPGSHPGDGINGARRGRSLPVHPGFSSHDYHTPKQVTHAAVI